MVGEESEDFRGEKGTKRMDMGDTQVCSIIMGFKCKILKGFPSQ